MAKGGVRIAYNLTTVSPKARRTTRQRFVSKYFGTKLITVFPSAGSALPGCGIEILVVVRRVILSVSEGSPKGD